MSNTTDPEWTSQEDDLLFSLLHWTRSGIRSDARRPWKDIAVDMNAETLRLGMETRFFQHENVHRRWWLKYGRFFPAARTSDEAGPSSRAPDAAAATTTTTNLAALQDILARVGVESLNGQPLPPPARRGFQLPGRRRSWLRDAFSGTAAAGEEEEEEEEEVAAAVLPPRRTTTRLVGAVLVVRAPGVDHLGCDEAGSGNRAGGGGGGSRDGNVDEEAGGGPNDGLGAALVGAGGKGDRVVRDPARSWLF